MNNKSVELDKSRIANATEDQLSKMLSKYQFLKAGQDSSIHNLELALESSKNKKALYNSVISAVNIAMMKYNTVKLYHLNGNIISIDRENLNDFLQEGYIRPTDKVFILKKSTKSTKVKDVLSIEEYQKIFGTPLHKVYELKEVAKNTFAIIGEEEQVKHLLSEANESLVKA